MTQLCIILLLYISTKRTGTLHNICGQNHFFDAKTAFSVFSHLTLKRIFFCVIFALSSFSFFLKGSNQVLFHEANWFQAWNHLKRFEMNKKVWKRLKKSNSTSFWVRTAPKIWLKHTTTKQISISQKVFHFR